MHHNCEAVPTIIAMGENQWKKNELYYNPNRVAQSVILFFTALFNKHPISLIPFL